MLHAIKEYFYFSRSEKRGVLILSALIFLSFFIPDGYKWVQQRTGHASDTNQQVKKFLLLIESDSADHVNSKTNNGTQRYRQASWMTEHGRKPLVFPQTWNKKGPVFDLNSADSLDLLSISGIGPYLAHKILQYRQRLGGYYSCRQLLEIRGFDAERYQSVHASFFVDTLKIKPMNVNTIDFKMILKHPYGDYQVAKAWIQFRKAVGVIQDPEELKKGGVIPDTTYKKLRPYLSVK